jgi:uncharacterized membrane protein
MAETNPNARLEAFCDGVFAIALTLLIIDIKPPEPELIHSNAEFWRAIQHLGPSVFSFLLSFGIILIAWVNHHGALRLMARSSASFMYANGLLLLTIVIIPFPTSLLGNFLFTEHAAPAVVLYNAVLGAQSFGWIAMGRSALKHKLAKSEKAAETIRVNSRSGYYALVYYSLLAVLAFWFPLTSAAINTASWIFWLVLGVRIKHE